MIVSEEMEDIFKLEPPRRQERQDTKEFLECFVESNSFQALLKHRDVKVDEQT